MADYLANFKDEQDYRNQFDKMYHIWSTNGIDYDSESRRSLPRKVKLADTLSLPNATFLIPQVINEFLREPIEPLLVGPSLLTRINYKPGMTISFPSIGALTAYDIGPGQEFPESGPDLGGAEATEIKCGKSGISVKFLDELIEQDNFGLIKYWIQLAGSALRRHKEVKIFNFINANGVTLFNNAASYGTNQTPMLGRTTGRDLNGNYNGTLTHDDFFDAVAFGMQQGYTYNTIVMHPLTWAMWVKDPYLRAFAMQAGSPNFFAAYNGDPTNRSNNWGDPIQKMGPTPQGINADPAHNLASMSQNMNTSPNLPNYFPFPMRIVVSPFVRFVENSATSKVTDILMFDSSNLGALIVKDDIQTAEWKEPSRDITKMKIWESYALALLNQGQGVAVLRNIKVSTNQLALPAELTMAVNTLPTGWAGY